VTWDWKPIGLPTSQGAALPGPLPHAGTPRIAVTSGVVVHLLVQGPEQVQHLTIDRNGTLQPLPDLPLRTLSSAVADGSGVAVGGAAIGDHRPSVCRVDGSGESELIALPTTLESGDAAPVGAWPRLAFGEDLWVSWAVGREPAEIWQATVSQGDAHTIGQPLSARFVLDLQVSATAVGVAVLWQDADGIHARQDVNRPGESATAPVFSSKSRLVNGVVLTPRPAFGIEVFEMDSVARHQLQLPAPPEAGNAQIIWAETVVESASGSTYLVWATETGSEDLGDPPGLSAQSRSWVALIDGSWRLGPTAEIPAFSQCFAALVDRVFAFPVTGPVLGWWGIPT